MHAKQNSVIKRKSRLQARSRAQVGKAKLPVTIKTLPAAIGFLSVAALQLALWPTEANAISVGGCVLGGGVALIYLADRQRWLRFPLSCMSLGGFALYYFFLPPLVTLAEQSAASSYLVSPSRVAIHSVAGFVTLVVSHFLYTRIKDFKRLKKWLHRVALNRLGIYAAPSPTQAYFIGGLALLAGLFKLQSGEDAVVASQGISAKLLHGISPFFTFPYLLLIPRVFGLNAPKTRVTANAPLIVYSIAIVAYGAMQNSRSTIFVGLASVALAMAWGHLSGVSRSKLFKPAPMIALGIVLLLGATQAADLATAMVIARNGRDEATAMQQMQKTLEAFQDKDAIRRYRELSITDDKGILDETYVSNVFFSRLCNLRFLDISLDLESQMQADQKSELLTFELQRALSIFPRPVLALFGIRSNKGEVNSMSSGDKMLSMVTGRRDVLGGFRTGSMLGNGFAVFGWFYLIPLSVLAIPSYFLLDAFSVQLSRREAYLSPLCITILFVIFFRWTSAATGCESISAPFGFILRGWLQMTAVYVVLFWITKTAVEFAQPRNTR